MQINTQHRGHMVYWEPTRRARVGGAHGQLCPSTRRKSRKPLKLHPLGIDNTMATKRAMPKTIDEYISGFTPDVQTILQRVRQVVRSAAPDAQETISYRIPAFKLNGMLVYFAAFKKHIGFYPPIRGDSRLEKALSRYAGEKGNLRFPLDQPIPYALVERITKRRVKQNLAKATARRKNKR